MKKRVVFILAVLLLASFVSADGFVMVNYDPDLNPDRWNPLQENSQFAFINHENGVEKMLISVSINTWAITGKEKVVWIFPVPASPEQTSIDILIETPDLRGKPFNKSVEDTLASSLVLMSLTQIYSAPFLFFTSFLTGRFLSAGGIDDLEVYEHIEKMGVTTELVSAKNSESLNNYVKSKNLTFPNDLNSILSSYINEDYCFVISWISNSSQFEEQANTREYRYSGEFRFPSYSFGVYVEFPNEEIYFPLKPTSVYGRSQIPIIIYVMDIVSPKLYPGIEGSTTTEYYYESYQKPYTKIKIQAPAYILTEDLIISQKAPVKIEIYGFILKHNLLLSIIILALLSCLSSLIAGTITFRKQNPYKLKFFLFGLFNLLTLIGISIASNKLKIEEKFVKIKKGASKEKSHLLKTSTIISLVITAVIDLIFIILFIPNLLHMTTPNLSDLLHLFQPLIALLILDCFIFGFLWIIITPIMLITSQEKRRSAFIVYFTVIFDLLLLVSWFIIKLIIV